MPTTRLTFPFCGVQKFRQKNEIAGHKNLFSQQKKTNFNYSYKNFTNFKRRIKGGRFRLQKMWRF